MIEAILPVIAYIMLGIGVFLVLTGSVGMIRFPDFYTRTHAACVVDSVGATFIMLAVLLLVEPGLMILKVVLLLLFSLITSATIAHALTKAALTDIVPLGTKLSKPRKNRKRTRKS